MTHKKFSGSQATLLLILSVIVIPISMVHLIRMTYPLISEYDVLVGIITLIPTYFALTFITNETRSMQEEYNYKRDKANNKK